MKTAAKVFIIIGIIFQFWMVLPLIIGLVALKKMKKGKPSVGLSVCVLIFVNALGGIFLLCSRESEYGSAPAAIPAPTYSAPAPAPTYSAPAPAYSAPTKEKSFKQEEDAPQGGSAAEDDLAAQMQRMFDSQN